MDGKDFIEVSILGAKYKLYHRSVAEDSNIKDCDGYTDWTTRAIVVNSDMSGSLGDLGRYKRKVTRHEIVHAFMFESGLAECAHEESVGACDEELVDWIAYQGPKLSAAWKEAGCDEP